MAELTKNSLHEVVIDGYTSEGFGVARIDGRAVFVRGAVFGERCEIKILKCAKNAVWAKIERIIDRAPCRQVPTCSVFGKCGGCDFLHID